MKKALFVSRKFDLVGQSAPSRYFLDIVKRMELLGYDISIAKLDFESYTKTKSLNLSFPYRLILPGFQNFFNYNLSLSYIFIFKWLYKFKKRPKYQRATELIIKSEKRFLKKLSKTNYDVIFVDYFFLAEGLSFFFGKKIIIHVPTKIKCERKPLKVIKAIKVIFNFSILNVIFPILVIRIF